MKPMLVLLLGISTSVCLQSFALCATTGDLEALRSRALALVNEARRAEGRAALTLAPATNEAAQAHARDMLRRDYYSHRSPEGDTVEDRFVAAGGSKWRLTAENIARCAGCTQAPDAERVAALHRGWMQSAGHRHNILRRGLRTFGFGIVADAQGGLYAVQTFAGPGVPRGLQPGEESLPLLPAQQLDHAAERINRARREAGLTALGTSSVLADAARDMLPEGDVLDAFTIDQNLADGLPSAVRRSFAAVSIVSATCGGCGTVPTKADVRYFVEQWLESYRSRLLDARVGELGFAIVADGEGRKIALGLLARER